MASYPGVTNPYNKTSSQDQGFSSYDPKSGVLTSGSQSYSVAPEKASAMLQQVETKKKKKKNKASVSPYVTPDPYKEAQGQSQALQTPQEIKQAVNSSPGNKSPVTSDKSNSLREAYLRSQAQQRQRSGSETLAPSPKVEQTAIRIGIDTREYNTITGEYLEGQDQRTRKLNEARQSFREKFLTQTDTAPTGFKGLKSASKLGGTILSIGAVSVAYGVGKGVKTAVKDVVTGQIITNTGEMLTEIATNPRGVVQQLSADFNKNPFSFTGEQVSYAYTLDKIPGVIKKTYQGSRSYIRRYEVAGSKYDPLTDPYNTFIDPNKDFSPGDLDIVTDIQTTIQGQRVNPDLVLKKSPLKLDETNFYKPAPEQKLTFKFTKEGNLEAKGSLINNNLILDDFIKIPEIRYPVTGEISVDYGSIRVKAKVRDEKVFGETYVGERTRTDFYPDTNAPEYGKPIKNVYETETFKVEIKEKTPREIQKELNFGKRNIDGTDKYIGANIGLFTEIQKLGTEIINEFKPNIRELSPEEIGAPGNVIRGRPPILERVPIINYKSPYTNLNSPGLLVENQIEAPKSITEEKGILELENIGDLKTDYKIDERLFPPEEKKAYLTKRKTRQKTAYKIDQIQETTQAQGQIQEPITTPIYSPIISRRLVTPQKTKERPRVIIPVIKVKSSSPTTKVKGFDVLVKSRGKFKRVNTGALSRVEAINLGAFRVGNSASATFKILPSKLEKSQSFTGKGVLADFYSKGDLFIEKRSRRIKSLGELQQITYKGIQAQKFKKIF